MIDVELYGGQNDNLVEISLNKLRANEPLTDAVVTATILDSVSGEAVTGASLPVTMPATDQHYITNEETGAQVLAQRYRGTFPAELNLVYDKLYDVVITVVHAAGYDGEYIKRTPCKRRLL